MVSGAVGGYRGRKMECAMRMFVQVAQVCAGLRCLRAGQLADAGAVGGYHGRAELGPLVERGQDS